MLVIAQFPDGRIDLSHGVYDYPRKSRSFLSVLYRQGVIDKVLHVATVFRYG